MNSLAAAIVHPAQKELPSISGWLPAPFAAINRYPQLKGQNFAYDILR
jgi:hypothetical protein